MNRWTLGSPSSGLPVTQSTGLTPVNGTTYQNTFGVPIVMYGTAYLTSSSSAPYYFWVFLGPTSSTQQVLAAIQPQGGTSAGFPFTLNVPAGWYMFEFSGSGSGASGTFDGKVTVYENK